MSNTRKATGPRGPSPRRVIMDEAQRMTDGNDTALKFDMVPPNAGKLIVQATARELEAQLRHSPIGLCVFCVGERKAAEERGYDGGEPPEVRPALTMVGQTMILPNPANPSQHVVGIASVPACWKHIGTQPKPSSLVVP